jgi:hypothetical protein
MKRLLAMCLVLGLAGAVLCQTEPSRRITYREYFDKIHGGWYGKAIGLVLGVPKEYREPWPPSNFEYLAQIPDHFSDRASGDDVYVPLVTQIVLKKHGIHPTYEQYMKGWAERLFSGRIWVSCDYALDHYRAGILPPKTGQPGYNRYWNDMCSQMGTDIIGWVAPGLTNTAAEMSDFLGHMVNWGVGADGGVFVGAIDSEAFFTSDIEQLVRRARAVLPAGSSYGEMVDDVLRMHREQPDWRITRQLVAKKYNRDLNTQDLTGLINGAVVLIGLLYGDGDFAKSVLIAQKCRWDSDTNAATVAGIMGTVLGFSRIEPRWRMILHDTYENFCVRGLPRWMTFSDIARDTVEIGEKVIRENGGEVSGTGESRVFRIPLQQPRMLARREILTPELIERNEREMDQYYLVKLQGVTEKWDPRWRMTMASFETPPEVLPSYMGRGSVLKAQPGPRGVVLERTVDLPPQKHHYLRVGVAHHPTVFCEATGQPEIGRWRLELRVDGKSVGDYNVSTSGGLVVWEDPQYDLTAYAGKTVKLSLIALQGDLEFYRTSSTSYWSGADIISLDQPEPWR